MNRADLKRRAKESLKGKYGNAVGIIIIFMLISIVASACSAIPYVGFIIPTLVSSLIGFGLLRFFLKTSRGQAVSVNELWSCFDMWWLYFGISICSGFFIFAWSLLFIIPGIIASYNYRMAFYIALDNPDISCLDAIKKSKEMMKGHKWELFVLDLSFIGWLFLCGFTFGILSFYVIPYMSVTVANFYNYLLGINNNNPMNYTQPGTMPYQNNFQNQSGFVNQQPGAMPYQNNFQSQNGFINQQPGMMQNQNNFQSQNGFVNQQPGAMPYQNNFQNQNGFVNQQPGMMQNQNNFQSQNGFINQQPGQPMQSMQQESQPFQVPPVVQNNVNQNTDNTII